MKKYLFTLTVCLLALSITACSSFRDFIHNDKDADNLTAKPLALATQAYLLMGGDANSELLVTSDLERAYSANGTTQEVINRLLKKQVKFESPDAKDDNLDTLAREALDEKKPDFTKALTFAKAIKKPAIKSKTLLRIADELPKNKRLQVLHDAEKNIALSKDTKFIYEKRSKLLKLAKMYFESGDKQSARKTIMSSHDLLIRNTSSSNAIDFGTVAELESQLGIQPSTLCKLTRFLHKTKDRPIALAKITAAYLNHGYQSQVCIPDEELISAVNNMPDAGSRVREQLVLAEAWHARKEKNKSKQLYNDAIKSAKAMDQKYSNYRFVMQGRVLVSLKKTVNTKLYNSTNKDFWKQVNKIERPYQQSEALMQLISDAYLEGQPDMSLDVLSKMEDNALKITVGVDLARMAQKNNDHIVAGKALSEALLAAKIMTHPVEKINWLKEVINTAFELGNTKIGEEALNIAGTSVAKVPDLEMKIIYAIQLAEKAWEHKDDRLAQSLLKRTQSWHKQYLKNPKPIEKGASSSTIAYIAEAKNNMLINIMENQVLLGKYGEAMTLLDKLPSKKAQAKALVYTAIALAKKRKQQGVMETDKFMLNALGEKINSIRKYP